jgi:hypothetical protein
MCKILSNSESVPSNFAKKWLCSNGLAQKQELLTHLIAEDIRNQGTYLVTPGMAPTGVALL